MTKTRLAEKRHRDKLKKGKKETRLNNEKHRKLNKQNRKSAESYE